MLKLNDPLHIERVQLRLCLYCGAPAVPRGRYCCDTHRRAFMKELRPEKKRYETITANWAPWKNKAIVEIFWLEAQAVFRDAALEALTRPPQYPAGTCQLCGYLRATAGAFCLECEADLKAAELI